MGEKDAERRPQLLNQSHSVRGRKFALVNYRCGYFFEKKTLVIAAKTVIIAGFQGGRNLLAEYPARLVCHKFS